MKARLVWLCLGLSAIVFSGCGDGGPALYEVEGTVTYKGSPVKDAAVTLMFDGGQISSGTTGADGKFTVSTNGLPGAPVGSARVAISKFAGAANTANMTVEDMAKMATENQGASPAVPQSEIPEKYGVGEKSGLTAEVVAGGKAKNTFSFPLVD